MFLADRHSKKRCVTNQSNRVCVATLYLVEFRQNFVYIHRYTLFQKLALLFLQYLCVNFRHNYTIIESVVAENDYLLASIITRRSIVEVGNYALLIHSFTRGSKLSCSRNSFYHRPFQLVPTGLNSWAVDLASVGFYRAMHVVQSAVLLS